MVKYGKGTTMVKYGKLLITMTALVTVATACAANGGGDSPQDGDREPVELSVVGAFDYKSADMAGYRLFEEKIDETAPWIDLNYRGGPEVMAAAQLGEGVASGGIDMAATAATFHASSIPSAGAMVLSPLTAAEERKQGAIDVLQSAHNKAGIRYVGRMSEGVPYKLYFTDEQDPMDLSGLSMRTSPVYVALLEKLGAGPVAMPPGELYGALERGVVDGYGWPALDIVKNGWADVTSYETEVAFYQVDTLIIMGLARWDSLDSESQKAIEDAMLQTESELGELYAGLVEEEAAARAAAGIQVIEMDASTQEKFIEIANKARWSQVLKDAPDEAAQLREIYGN